MATAWQPELKQWRDGRWYFNTRTGAASPLWKKRETAERKAREYAEHQS